ncbi:carbohydrate-binding module family 18 protein [Plenodomus tracheiphilus IPT5]|uniref:Carbohydrate-binding module family 18 protein n=1 Tax=Plenodomus tracheiphilus IPT5 TaxID=1408161 RepID=A0A6A7AUA6_9PLEO|nr:carbohydrate-binding module family 18 protein [Plenodomus tracheiphilus IPT5]
MNVWYNIDFRQPTTTGPAPTVSPIGTLSEEGTCGGDTGFNCIGYIDGECCSNYGWCGREYTHCGVDNCDPAFGKCGEDNIPGFTSVTYIVPSTELTSPTAVPSGTRVSDAGECGPAYEQNCVGYGRGECCSQWGYCGDTNLHCDAGCQSDFGNCLPRLVVTSSASLPSATESPSSTGSPSATESPSAATPTPSAVVRPFLTTLRSKVVVCKPKI